jgi:predicted metal-dependent phosphoesterase TrpH
VSDPSLGGNSPGFIDLHTHSTASDGARLPADVVRAAAAIKLAAMALTDHDTVSGLPEAEAAGTAFGVRIIPGVELSAVEGDIETHILGLHIADRGEMERRLVSLREMRVNRALRIVERLNGGGTGAGGRRSGRAAPRGAGTDRWPVVRRFSRGVRSVSGQWAYGIRRQGQSANGRGD